VEQVAHSYLSAWESFYVIVGSSAGALTGLQFVVIALLADSRRRSTMHEVGAFGTPTVVHFCAVLLLSAVLSAPWHRLSSPALGLTACGVAGLVYVVLVVRRTRRQTGYTPVLEDWVWHAALPALAYGTLLVASILFPRQPQPSLFGIGAAAVLLVFVGIHNAWDAVTFIAVDREEGE
jgi:hypothetical protein